MAEWPSELSDPPLLDGNYQEVFPRTVLRTSMDAGPEKVRQRYTANVRPIQFKLALTDDLAAVLDDFFVNVCGGGSVTFDWTHPRTGEAVTARWKKEPTLIQTAPNLWTADCQIDVMPA